MPYYREWRIRRMSVAVYYSLRVWGLGVELRALYASVVSAYIGPVSISVGWRARP